MIHRTQTGVLDLWTFPIPYRPSDGAMVKAAGAKTSIPNASAASGQNQDLLRLGEQLVQMIHAALQGPQISKPPESTRKADEKRNARRDESAEE